ncbi:MAG TPA: efflux RND transporter periplasmic adaptor subunit [Kofleriaceae bacterium]|nr:efflux RND transporter periplasmic adaptor subunit [Kofleriaceae bacterium]
MTHLSRTKIAIVVSASLGAAFAFGLWRRDHDHHTAADEAIRRRVQVIKPTPVGRERALVLPGTIRGREETPIYARASGYVHSYEVDLGDSVAAGQVLAQLDTSEVDEKLARARALLAQARANAAQARTQRQLSQTTIARVRSLNDQQLIAKAEVDEGQARADVDAAREASLRAAVAAAEAELRLLTVHAEFTRVTAPFAGTITSRSVERGMLVREAETPLFTVVATDTVRIFVDVPQPVASSVSRGLPAKVRLRDLPGATFEGTVVRTAGALDIRTHTMRVEVQLPNETGALLAGMYVDVELPLSTPATVYAIPPTSLYVDGQGTRVATIDARGAVRFRKIELLVDTGAALHVAGITDADDIVKIAIPSLTEGESVEVERERSP